MPLEATLPDETELPVKNMKNSPLTSKCRKQLGREIKIEIERDRDRKRERERTIKIPSNAGLPN
jgi:hypothetical protein